MQLALFRRAEQETVNTKEILVALDQLAYFSMPGRGLFLGNDLQLQRGSGESLEHAR